MAKKTIDDVMAQYAAEEEAAGRSVNVPQEETNGPADALKRVVTSSSPQASKLAEEARQHVENSKSLKEAQEIAREEIINERIERGHGYIDVPLMDLPSQGVFYPEGTSIKIRAVHGVEIRHWSMISETELSEIDDALNRIIERCAIITFPNGQLANWKDLKEIDRFYLIIAIREFTFGESNKLEVMVSETDSIAVERGNIQFINIPDTIMKYYNSELRCFTFNTKTPAAGETLNIYLPSVGVTQWLKNYVQRKANAREQFDEDFIRIAPMLIKDYRGLNDNTYKRLIQSSYNFGSYEWSLLSAVKDVIERAVSPKLKYIDQSGAEQEAPLNFRGGLKAIFLDNVAEELGL